MGQVMNVGLSCYLIVLSFDSKPGSKTGTPSWPDPNESELILGMRRANERQCYFVTMSLNGWG